MLRQRMLQYKDEELKQNLKNKEESKAVKKEFR